LEVVALDELIQVHAQHLESEDEMLAEDELFLDANYVLLVLWIVVAELLQDLGFNEALLVEAFLVSKNFEGDVLLIFVIKTFEYLAEAALSEPVDDLETVADVLALLCDVLVLVVVEAVVVYAVWCGWWTLGGLAIVDVEPIDGIVVEDFLLFDLHKIFGKINNGCARVHRKFQFSLLVSEVAIACLLDDRREARGYSLLHA